MKKENASILILGYEPENERMYPHLQDVLLNLREYYAEVVYAYSDMRFRQLYMIDQALKKLPSSTSLSQEVIHTYNVLTNYADYQKKLKTFVDRLNRIRLSFDKRLIIAIDDHLFYWACVRYPDNCVLWSFDIFTRDCPYRLRDGLIDELVERVGGIAPAARGLIIQDKARQKLFEASCGAGFVNTVYLPVGLNDSKFCQRAARQRASKKLTDEIHIVQSGTIAANRWSESLVNAYQSWPAEYRLHLRGFIQPAVTRQVAALNRRPILSDTLYDNHELPGILDRYDIGFVGYKEDDANHRYIEHASSQLVQFLRLGLPVITCGSDELNRFVDDHHCGIGVCSMGQIPGALEKINRDYGFFSGSARKLFEEKFNLGRYFITDFCQQLDHLISGTGNTQKGPDGPVPKTISRAAAAEPPATDSNFASPSGALGKVKRLLDQSERNEKVARSMSLLLNRMATDLLRQGDLHQAQQHIIHALRYAPEDLQIKANRERIMNQSEKPSPNWTPSDGGAHAQIGPPSKLLSILCQGRNDSYLGNFIWRLATVINQHSKNLHLLGCADQVELLVADWGSEVPLYETLELTPEARRQVKFLIVPPTVTKIYDKDAVFSVPHAINAIARRSSGKFLTFSDSDIYVPLASMKILMQALQRGNLGRYDLRESFFWASKVHVPNELVMRSPALEELDQEIEKNWPDYVQERVSKENFAGCGAALLMSREMWFESRGWDERLIYWGWNDIDFHRRLATKYKWEDLLLHGIRIFHLEHYVNRFENYINENPRKKNPYIEPTCMAPNPDNWGLKDHNLIFVDGYGQPVSPDRSGYTKSFAGNELDRIIAPEIKNDKFYDMIEKIAAEEPVGTILEIGSASGDGSTAAFVAGLKKNPHHPTLFCLEISQPRFVELQKRYANLPFVKCHHASSVGLDKFPGENDIVQFYESHSTKLNQYPLDRILNWYWQDVSYLQKSDVPAEGIRKIKVENNIEHFD
ncbi:MAG: hypothetical protein JSW26_19850, partial [Desulfobacterales bacterium]